MKHPLKNILRSLARHPYLSSVCNIPSVVKYVANGCTGCPPCLVKHAAIKSYLHDYRLSAFVETGTYMGDTLAAIARLRRCQCVSIELSKHHYSEAVKRFADDPNVRLIHGDSATILPEVIRQLQKPALFWLDGHYSAGNTAKGDVETPIRSEINAILESGVGNHVILIDDMHCFTGTNDYPTVEELLATIRLYKGYKIEISTNIARITPADTFYKASVGIS